MNIEDRIAKLVDIEKCSTDDIRVCLNAQNCYRCTAQAILKDKDIARGLELLAMEKAGTCDVCNAPLDEKGRCSKTDPKLYEPLPDETG